MCNGKWHADKLFPLAVQVYVKNPQDVEKQRQAPSGKCSDRNSLPLDIERNLCAGNKNNEAYTVEADYMESLILLTSQAGSWQSSDDEMVDLTEPRFESFCMTNTNFPW